MFYPRPVSYPITSSLGCLATIDSIVPSLTSPDLYRDGILPAPFTLDQVSSTARLILGYTSTTSPGLHLDLNNPLGLDIPIYVPPFRYDFVLPSNLTTRSTYIVSFQGSSGNISPVFTINGNDASPAPASSSSSSPSPKPKPAATPASSSDDSGGDAPGPSTTALSTQYLAPSPTSIGSGIADAQAATQPVVIANAGATTANMIPITPFSATAVGVLGASSSGAPTTSGSNGLVVSGWIGIAGVVSTILMMV